MKRLIRRSVAWVCYAVFGECQMAVIQDGYVVRSGYGFLRDPATGEMVANRLMPDSAVFDAHRYDTESEAETDAAKMRERGLEAVVVSINRVPYTSA